MRLKKLWAVVLATTLVFSMSACGNDKKNDNKDNQAGNTVTPTDKVETNENGKNDKNNGNSDNNGDDKNNGSNDNNGADKNDGNSDKNDSKDNKAESVLIHYGWDTDDEDYVAKIYCPKGAKFSEDTLENQKRDGWVLSANLDDEENEYVAMSNCYWHRDAYAEEPFEYSIVAQLYFDGEIDAKAAENYSDCVQKVTPLGFQWEGKDVILIETKYTYDGYSDQKELFAGIEYDLEYWDVEESSGQMLKFTTKGLFGFDMYKMASDDLTKEQCAWIMGELFGADSGVTNPFPDVKEETPVTETHILKLNKKIWSEYEWSDKYRIPLAESEHSAILLEEEEAGRYPELAATLKKIAKSVEDNWKEEYAQLKESAKEMISQGAEGFEPLVSTLDAQVRRADTAVVSVLTDSYLYNGFNGGYRGFWGGNYDTETGKELHFLNVVTNLDKFVDVVENELYSTVGVDALYSETIIAAYFEEYIDDGIHWVLDYNGVTVYFCEGEIASSGVGTLTVTVPFAEYPELFNEKYTRVPDLYMVALPQKSVFYTDLNGNGSCEELTVTDRYDAENTFYATVDIYTEETLYTESFWAYDCETYYVKNADGKHYLYLFTELETQMYLYVYEITSKTISKVGEADLTPFYEDGISTVLTDPDYMHFSFFSEGAGGGVPDGDDFFSISVDGMPAQG